jgi:two-component system NtrC family sensor kinase
MGTQLIMAGRLAEVGEMSAGVAHEINNPLQVMKSEYTLIQEILKDAERAGGAPTPEDLRQIRESVEEINQQIDRCKEITQGLLKFARKTEPTIQPIELPSFVHGVVSMVEHGALLENIRIVEKSQHGLEPVESDPAQLQQVFLNLLNNAINALKGRENAEIRITVGKEDGYATVAVADNGCGIPPENLEKIFLPFFTTKPVGQGTGLGLAISYGIVERHGGELSAANHPRGGAVFRLVLPLANAS